MNIEDNSARRWQLLKAKHAKARYKPKEITFNKTIYDFKNKKSATVKKSLQLEANTLAKEYVYYEFTNIQAGAIAADGSATYTFIFTLKK